jgi:AcrR family transcriptional regulator
MVNETWSGGLRERAKARRRAVILRTAYRLFAEQGFEETTIAEVAEAAEVSPRTVTLYFPSKLALALDRSEAMAHRLTTALGRREPGRRTLDAIESWLREEFAHRSELDDLSERMFNANPQLRAASNGRLGAAVREGARLFAAETGGDPVSIGPRVAAATTAVVIGELFHHPEDADINAAMAFLRAAVATLERDPGRPGTEGDTL